MYQAIIKANVWILTKHFARDVKIRSHMDNFYIWFHKSCTLLVIAMNIEWFILPTLMFEVSELFPSRQNSRSSFARLCFMKSCSKISLFGPNSAKNRLIWAGFHDIKHEIVDWLFCAGIIVNLKRFWKKGTVLWANVHMSENSIWLPNFLTVGFLCSK